MEKEIVEEVEVEEPEVIQIEEGQDCSFTEDCGKKVPLGDSFCLGLSKYQKFATPGCTFKEGSNTDLGCRFDNITERIGACDLE